MNDFASPLLSATWAGPSKRRSILSNGIIHEVEPISYGPELLAYLEEAEYARAQRQTATLRGEEWRDTRLYCTLDDDTWDSTSSPSQSLAAYMADGRMTAPVLLIPPSRTHLGWTVTPAESVDAQTFPKQVFLVISSIPLADAWDELCLMMARMSMQEDDICRTPRPASPQFIDDVCRLLDKVSLREMPQVEQEDAPITFAEYEESSTSGYTDDESFYDGSSDATYVEEDSTLSWTTVCEEAIEEETSPKEMLLGAVVERGYPSPEKWTKDTTLLEIVLDCPTPMAVDAASVAACLGFRSRRPVPPSTSSLFAPALRTLLSL